jgi:D-alanyl-D-alanine carboxypeptidase
MKKCLSLLLFICIFNVSAQSFDTAKLDKYLAALDENEKAMFSLAVVEDGKPVYENSIGYADLATKKEANKHTQYRIGSITKVFTSVMIFQLIEEGKLSLDTTLAGFYPNIRNADKITISMLLSHRSGIHNFTNKPEFSQYMTSPKSKGEMIEIIEALESDFKPGSQTRYSNSGYLLLGFIIEDITKATYAHQLKQRITMPLNLTRTIYGGAIDVKRNQANSYKPISSGWAPASLSDMSIPHGAVAIVSTPTEVATFLSALFSDKLVSAESLSKMKEINQGLGRGLFQFPFYDKKAYGHNGTIDGFNSVVAYFADDNVAFGLTANGLNYSLNDINIAVLSIYYGLDYKIPDFSASPVELTKEDLAKYEGVFASKELPLKITLKVKSGSLTAQATGQKAFNLTPYSELEFRFSLAGIVLMFESGGNEGDSSDIDYTTFELQQGGGKYVFTRE